MIHITGWVQRWIRGGYAAALSLAITAPLLAPGYLLLRDAVSTPRSYLSDAALGLSQAAPRAVPQDFLIAVASVVVDGGRIVVVALIVALLLAGWGAAQLVGAILPEGGLAAQVVATTVAVWNPYVAERLLQGQWSLLIGYGCLPWVALSVIRLRTGIRGSYWPVWAAVVLWIFLAGVTPTGLMLAVMMALVCCAVRGEGVPRWWCVLGIVSAAVGAASPWLVASIVGTGLAAPGSTGVAVFAARAEPGLGTLGSVAGLAGMWNADAVPVSRTTGWAFVATLVLLIVVGLGAAGVARRPRVLPLVVVAVFSVVVPTLMATSYGMAVLDAVIHAVPQLGVLRDGQKWVALAMPGYAVCAAGVVVALRRWVRPAVSAVVCVVVLVAVLPDLAWGVGARMVSVQYPAGWGVVANIINADPGLVAVLPAGSMRQFDWAGSAPVLDPLPRWLRADVLSTGDLLISGQLVRGEGAIARGVQQRMLAGDDPAQLAAAGVRWVVVEVGSPGALGASDQLVRQLDIAYRDADVILYRVDNALGHSAVAPRTVGHSATTLRAIMVGVHVVWLFIMFSAAGISVVGMIRCPRSSGLNTAQSRCLA